MRYDDIPWAMSELGRPREAPKEPTPAQQERAREDAEYWAKAGLATRDRCNHCPKLYDELSPECANAKLHECYTAEREKKLEAKDELHCVSQ